MRPRQGTATGRREGEGRIRGEGETARRRTRARAIRLSPLVLAWLATVSIAASAANPLSAIGETFSDWKDRLFGKPNPTVDAPADGTVSLAPKQPTRLRIGKDTPERDFPKGKSRFRVIDLTTFPAPSGIADLRPRTSGNIGVFLTSAGSPGSWSRAGANLPNASTNDLVVAPGGRYLISATHGRGIWRFDG